MAIKQSERNYRKRIAKDQDNEEDSKKRKIDKSDPIDELREEKKRLQKEIDLGLSLLQSGCDSQNIERINSANSVIQGARAKLAEVQMREAQLTNRNASANK